MLNDMFYHTIFDPFLFRLWYFYPVFSLLYFVSFPISFFLWGERFYWSYEFRFEDLLKVFSFL